jgi:ABC-type multidrug transport system ATPase subunit
MEIKNLSFSFKNKIVFEGVNLSFKRGETIGLFGQNSSGKTTFLNCLAGLYTNYVGEIILERGKLYYILDTPYFYNNFSLIENIYFFSNLNLCNTNLDKLLSEFKLKEHKNTAFKKLSYGNRKKIPWILSKLNNPEILLVDEAFNGLDNFSCETIHDLINEYKNNGCISIICSHDLENLNKTCDYIIKIENGKFYTS